MFNKINKSNLAYCGLVCALCMENISGKCKGCRNKNDACGIKKCSISSGLKGCYECKSYPCEQGMFQNPKIQAFNKCAKEDGIEQLVTHLNRNEENGVIYHNVDGTPGDYDALRTEVEVSTLLKMK